MMFIKFIIKTMKSKVDNAKKKKKTLLIFSIHVASAVKIIFAETKHKLN